MMKFCLTLCLILSATSLSAGDTMTADEFDAYTRNQTFYYGKHGKLYGAEEYLSDRRVIWTFLDGRCEEGSWYQEGEQICFTYKSHPDPQCWSFRRAPNGIIVQHENDPEENLFYQIEKSYEPLVCPGPEVGV